MSASEKLKALDERGFPVVTDATLRRALPQIAAVVEAGERLDADLETNSAAGSPNYMVAALAALDEALK